MRKSEAALLLHSRVGERFDAVVTGVSDQGTWVRTFEPPVEGRLRGHVPDLKVGKLVRVHLVSTSVERGFVDFALERSAAAAAGG
jgi:exoribonuclease-2